MTVVTFWTVDGDDADDEVQQIGNALGYADGGPHKGEVIV